MNTSHSGIHYLLQGLRLLREPGLRRYVAMPLLVSTLCFAGAIYGLAFWLDGLLEGYSMRWTLSLIFVCIVVGAINVYLFVRDH